MAVRVLEVHLVGDGVSLDRALLGSARAADTAASSIERAGTRISRAGTKMTAVGRTWNRTLTLPLVAVGALAMKTAFDFERAMSLISTQAGGTRKEVDHLEKSVLKLAKATQFTPQELADGLYHIESAGYRGAKAMTILNESQKLATVGNSDMQKTTYALVSAVKALGVEGFGPTSKVAAELNAIVGLGDMRMEELTTSLSSGVISTARAAGLGLRDVGAAMDIMTSRGEPAQIAATRLRMSIALMSAPTEKAQKALQKINLSALSLASTMRKEGLPAAVAELAEHLQSLNKTRANQVLAEAFGGGRSSGAIKALVLNFDELIEKEKLIGKGVKNYNRDVKEAEEQPLVEMKKAWATISADMVEVGESVGPVVLHTFQGLVGTIDDLAHTFSGLSDGEQEFIVKAGLIVAAIGPVLSITGRLVSGWGKIVELIGKAGVAMGVFDTTQAAGGVAGGAAGGIAGGAAGGAMRGSAPAAVGAYGEKAALEKSGLFAAGTIAGPGSLTTAGKVVVPASIVISQIVVGNKTKKIDTGSSWTNTLKDIALAGPEVLWEPTNIGPIHLPGISHTGEVLGGKDQKLGHFVDEQGLKPKLSDSAVKQLKTEFHGLMKSLSTDAIFGMGYINHDFGEGLHHINLLFGKNTPQWRKYTLAAMKQTVKAIEEGMESGTISTKQGQQEINRLLRKIKFVQGRDPVKIGEGMANSFQEAGRITRRGVQQWQNQMELMPKGAQKAAAETTEGMLREWAQGHPKLEKQIDQLTNFQIRKFGATNKQLREGVKKGATGPVAEAYKELAAGVGGSLQNIGVNTQQVLKALGVKNIPAFQIVLATGGTGGKFTAPGSAEVGTSHRQTGGPVGFRVPGHGDGDIFRTEVPAGSFVMNREATAHFGFQSGGRVGHVPVALEPKERVFMPHEVERIGLHTLKAMNNAVQRFQTGGTAIPHPHLVGGIDSLREGGNNAIDRGYAGAAAYIRKHSEPSRILHALHAMEEQARKGYPYVFGGGHSGFHGPFDCSGYVSYGLHAAGFLDTPMSVQQGSGLYTLGAAGPGKFLTWGVRGTSGANAHTMMAIKKPGDQGWGYFESGGSGGGAHEDSGWDGSFQFRHMPGYQEGGVVGMPAGAKEAIAKFGQEAFNPKSPHFVGWGFQQGGQIKRVGPDLRRRFHEAALSLWGRARRFYPGQGGAGMPPTLVMDLPSGTAGETSRLGHGKTAIIDKKEALGIITGHEPGRPAPVGQGTLLHEWAHVFQIPGLKQWESEGGAEDFKLWAGQQLFGHTVALGSQTRRYFDWAQRVQKYKGGWWIDYGQFGQKRRQRGGHLGYQQGGEVLSKTGQKTKSLMQNVWQYAAHLFGRSPDSKMPRASFDTDVLGGAFVGDVKVFGPHGGEKKNYTIWPEWFERRILNSNVGKETILHEWAHYFQRPGLFKSNWEREGGAEAFARWAAPGVFGAAGIPYNNPPFGKGETYYPYVQRVLKDKGMGWVEHGQFKGFQKGGLVELSSGGPVPPKGGEAVGASYYGGPTDHVSGTVGAAGVPLAGTSSFAELAMGHALGGLPMHTKLRFTRNGHSVVAEKLDIGLGGDAVSGHNRAVDFWFETGAKLGIGPNNGVGVVHAEPTSEGVTTGTAKKEIVPGMFHGLHTKLPGFPSIPKNMEALQREISKCNNEVGRYKQAIKAAKGKSGLVHALEACVTELQDRLKELRRARTKLKKEIVKKRFKKRLARKLGRITGYETQIEADEKMLERAEALASQIVDLEPTQGKNEDEKKFEESYIKYVEGEEKPAYQHVLDAAGGLRDTILRAELYGFGKDRPSADNQERAWERQLRSLDGTITHIEGLKRPKATETAALKHYEEQIARLPSLKFKRHEFESSLGGAREAFYAGGTNRVNPPRPPIAGSGSFEDALVNVQGIHWPDQHELLGALPVIPVPGQFGGTIWDTQMAIRELGLKIAEATGGSGSSESSGEKLALIEEQQARERRERVALEANLAVMASGIGTIGPKGLKATYPWAGRYAEGGAIAALVGEEGPEIATFRPGTHITPADETRQLLQPRVEVNNHHYPDHTETEVLIDGKQMDAVVNHVATQLGQRANHRAQTVSNGRVGTL